MNDLKMDKLTLEWATRQLAIPDDEPSETTIENTARLKFLVGLNETDFYSSDNDIRATGLMIGDPVQTAPFYFGETTDLAGEESHARTFLEMDEICRIASNAPFDDLPATVAALESVAASNIDWRTKKRAKFAIQVFQENDRFRQDCPDSLRPLFDAFCLIGVTPPRHKKAVRELQSEQIRQSISLSEDEIYTAFHSYANTINLDRTFFRQLTSSDGFAKAFERYPSLSIQKDAANPVFTFVPDETSKPEPESLVDRWLETLSTYFVPALVVILIVGAIVGNANRESKPNPGINTDAIRRGFNSTYETPKLSEEEIPEILKFTADKKSNDAKGATEALKDWLEYKRMMDTLQKNSNDSKKKDSQQQPSPSNDGESKL